MLTRLNMLKLYSSNLQIEPDVDLRELARFQRASQEATYAMSANQHNSALSENSSSQAKQWIKKQNHVH